VTTRKANTWNPGKSVRLPAPQHRRPPDRDSEIRRTSFAEQINSEGTTGSWRVRSRHPGRAAGTTGLRQQPTTRSPGGPAMITLTGNGRLTRDVTVRTTHSGKTVATISVASDRRDRDAQPVYVDLIVWQAQATAAAEHLVKGQAVSFCGRFEPRDYVTGAGENRVALELHGVDVEYGPKPRIDQASAPAPSATHEADPDDIPF
jgi:single-stranded DNA-binding protein